MIESLRLQQYRSYDDETFEFDDGVNIIVGPNASGKTNLLEGVLVVCRGNSFRARDSELIKFDRPWARLDAKVASHFRTVKITKNGNGTTAKQFTIDNNNLSRLPLNRQLRTILFEPNHLMILHGPPEARREYLDGVLSQIEQGYARQLRDYKRALAQRNALLKQGTRASSRLFAWNIRLSELGGNIAAARTAIVDSLANHLKTTYMSLTGSKNTNITITYTTICRVDDYASSMLSQLEARQDTDIERGYTTIGPHRDDITLFFGGRPAAEVASRGETRTVVLALKIIELGLIGDAFGQKPVVLLDDVFSELDGKRRKALTEVIKGYQTFITTTDADVVVQHFMGNCRIIPL